MDLLSLIRTLWHFKWITAVVLLATGAGVGIFLVAGPRVYEVQASYVLVNPPVPSDADLVRNPALRNLNSNNPYLRFGSQAMVGQVLASRLGGQQVRASLIAAGADKDYMVTPSNDFGGAGQIVQVTALGPTPESSAHTADLVITRMVAELKTMQKIYGADDRYLMTALPIEPPGLPQQQTSGAMRSVIGIAGAGAIVLFTAISVAQAVEQTRRTPKGRRHRSRRAQRGRRLRRGAAADEPLKPPPLDDRSMAEVPEARVREAAAD
jgi:hypothetical protein